MFVASINPKTDKMATPSKLKFKTVEEYISALPQPAKTIMQEIRRAIKKAAPEAEELMSYADLKKIKSVRK